MDKPTCIGNYTPAARTPCAGCAWRGPCAVRTTVGPFTFLAHPRYPREVERPDLSPMTRDTAIVQQVVELAAERGLTYGGGFFIAGRRRLARVDPGVCGTVLLKFHCVPAYRVSEMPSAARASVKRILAKTKTTVITRRQLREKNRLGEVGSTALLSSAEDAVNLLVDIARNVYGDSRD